MPGTVSETGKLISALPEAPKKAFGLAILDGLRAGRFTFTNPIATEGGDYDQTNPGDYTQSGGGNHNQGGGGYNQSKMVGNLGRLDVSDLAEIMSNIKTFDR